MTIQTDITAAVRTYVQVPAHIAAIAGACAADLLFGPRYTADCEPEAFDADSVATFPDDVEGTPVELYTSRAADALRAFLSDSVPSVVYVDADAGVVIGESEPDSSEECPECGGDGCDICDGSGRIEACMESIYQVDSRDIVTALFGQTIAREFN